LDLDTDLSEIIAAFSIDRRLRPLIEAWPGRRIVGYPDPFEGAAMTVMGQRVSLAAARVFAGRLVASYRQPTMSGLYVFPTAADLAATTPASIQERSGMTRSRASTVHSLAAAVADGLQLDPAGDHNAAIRDLSSLPGIGPWTLAHIRIRSLGEHDVFPTGDRVLQRALGTTDSHVAAAAAEAWRPYRSYAAAHLWASVPTSSAHINQ
jgi:AraC family transcriptional regulator of adaptative response / DNA-3-methyladenine glycosylase II